MIYLDNAATTFPKPRSVYRAAIEAMTVWGGNPGRSGHRLSVGASRLIYSCREEVASLFGGLPENVVLTLNSTYALNIALNSLCKRGGRVLISELEHNAVLRTVKAFGKYEVFSALCDDGVLLESLESGLRRMPSAVVCCHSSNLIGRVLPVEAIGTLCRRYGVPLIIDASQSAGRLPLDIGKSGADAICAPSHKGLFGIQGCGFVLFADKYRDEGGRLNTFVYGGNGVDSLLSEMPEFLPERLEAGTLPTPAAASLAAGIKEVKALTLPEISGREARLGDRFRQGLSVIGGVTVYGGEYGGGTVLFNMKGKSPETVSELLDGRGIYVRGGYHCCPLGHKALGTGNGGVRVSFSPFNTVGEVDRTLYILSLISKA